MPEILRWWKEKRQKQVDAATAVITIRNNLIRREDVKNAQVVIEVLESDPPPSERMRNIHGSLYESTNVWKVFTHEEIILEAKKTARLGDISFTASFLLALGNTNIRKQANILAEAFRRKAQSIPRSSLPLRNQGMQDQRKAFMHEAFILEGYRRQIPWGFRASRMRRNLHG